VGALPGLNTYLAPPYGLLEKAKGGLPSLDSATLFRNVKPFLLTAF